MAATTGENLGLESAHTADEIKSYVLRTDSIALCCVADVHSIPQALKGTINCIKKRPVRLETSELVEGSTHFQSRGYDIGDTVSVVGKIQDYKEQRQIFVSSIQSRHILEVLEQHETRYSQPFTIPPLPIAATPPKHSRSESQSHYASSMASTPTTTGFSSPSRSPVCLLYLNQYCSLELTQLWKKDRARLRHPSRLRSKDLNENVFRIYLSHVLISTLSLPESSLDNSASIPENDNNSTPKPSRVWSSATHRETTPKRPSRAQDDVFGSPTPKKPTAQYQLAPVPAEPTGPLFGVTLSYLRRVQVLADLAGRVVDQAAHERDKAWRHAEKSERAKYEVSRKHKSQPKTSRSADELGSSLGTAPPASSRSTKSSYNNSSSRHTSTTQIHSSSVSSRASSSTAKSPSRAKAHRTEALTPTEAARRAAYHAKQSKLHAEDAVKRPARTKRLFESALRTLVSEGGAVLHDGPKRHVPSSTKLAGKRALPTLSGIWPDVTNTTTASSSGSLSMASSMLSGQVCSDLENTLEDNEVAELSDPSDGEDAYLPVTPQTLRPVLLAALRQSLMRHRGGVDFASWMRTLRGDEQWARVPDLVLNEALEVFREEEWIDKVGGGRWNFTRGSWARSLTLS
ncbi:hypothetical protein FRC10_000565 [Ceratobasidium sp. 414]|nr:hypothetical protein FRC10_000565 [Ceratobasidium sp. 414]